MRNKIKALIKAGVARAIRTVVQTGIEYSEAIDVAPIRYSYIETDKKIEDNDSGGDR
jgi:hypothetical protein